jgi:hypothetical protein
MCERFDALFIFLYVQPDSRREDDRFNDTFRAGVRRLVGNNEANAALQW